jgi:hypothetical protein
MTSRRLTGLRHQASGPDLVIWSGLGLGGSIWCTLPLNRGIAERVQGQALIALLLSSCRGTPTGKAEGSSIFESEKAFIWCRAVLRHSRPNRNDQVGSSRRALRTLSEELAGSARRAEDRYFTAGVQVVFVVS